MWAFLLVQLGFLPVGAFLALASITSLPIAFGVGAVLALGWTVWQRQVRPIELAMAAYMVVGFVAVQFLVVPMSSALAVAGSFWVMGLTAAGLAIFKRAWTADYSRQSYAAVAATPLFWGVNYTLSVVWALIFLLMGGLVALHAHGLWTTALALSGAVMSIFGPRWALAFAAKWTVRQRERFHWRQPAFSKADDYDVVVVGAGLGGLTAAALLAQAGLRVCVAEKELILGGFAQNFTRKVHHGDDKVSFRFDAGVHDVSGVGPGGSVSGLLARLGVDLDWVKLDRSLWVEGAPFAVDADWRRFAADLGQRFPASAEGISALFATIKQIYDDLYALGAGHCGVPMPPSTPSQLMAFAQDHPTALKWMNRPFAELVGAYVSEPRAIAVLMMMSGYVSDKGDELSVLDMVPLYGYFFFGGHYPKGGSGMIGKGLAVQLGAFGGEVMLGAPVTAISVEGERVVGVQLDDGRVIRAAAVIASADIKTTCAKLLHGAVLPAGFRAKLDRIEDAASAFLVSLGLDFQPDLAAIAHVAGADGRGLGVVCPSRVDATAATPGYGTLELITLLSLDQARTWLAMEDEADYQAAKRAFGDGIIALAERLVPNLSGHIVYRTDASPRTFRHYQGSPSGSIYGLAKSSRYKGLKGPVTGLYFASSSNGGPGVEAVMLVGAWVAECLVPGLLARVPN